MSNFLQKYRPNKHSKLLKRKAFNIEFPVHFPLQIWNVASVFSTIHFNEKKLRLFFLCWHPWNIKLIHNKQARIRKKGRKQQNKYVRNIKKKLTARTTLVQIIHILLLLLLLNYVEKKKFVGSCSAREKKIHRDENYNGKYNINY